MTITENFDTILKKIRKAERMSGREEGGTTLVAVTKTQSQEVLREALASGHRCFGENRVQEAMLHWQDLKKTYPDIHVRLIGPLQTNKVGEAVSLFDCIETLDREKLAVALSAEMKKQGRVLSLFIQVNTGEEDQKGGVMPRDLESFIAFCRKDCGLQIDGLMCIPPVEEPPALHFAFLKKLAGAHGIKQLSMGMSADYQKAIALGATHVRLGSALFGERV